MFRASMLPAAFNNDWSFQYGNQLNDYLIRSVSRSLNNGTCNCVISDTCQESLHIGPLDLVLPDLVKGCSPIDGLQMSTLECFFSSNCIDTILTYLEYYTQMDGSSPISFVPPTVLPMIVHPLDNSISSRFLPNTSIDILISELFVEQLNTTISYENYFKSCAPSICHYEYERQNDILYVATSVLGLYGGLTIILRFITWNSTVLLQAFTNYLRMRRTMVRPTA
ncbi:unnamed protein product [Rotaria sp. Silwood2]|nr:unnamed protein product [Rotaria sp. Silwood2]